MLAGKFTLKLNIGMPFGLGLHGAISACSFALCSPSLQMIRTTSTSSPHQHDRLPNNNGNYWQPKPQIYTHILPHKHELKWNYHVTDCVHICQRPNVASLLRVDVGCLTMLLFFFVSFQRLPHSWAWTAGPVSTVNTHHQSIIGEWLERRAKRETERHFGIVQCTKQHHYLVFFGIKLVH